MYSSVIFIFGSGGGDAQSALRSRRYGLKARSPFTLPPKRRLETRRIIIFNGII